MHDSRLISLLKILHKSELLPLEKFLSSPYYNERPKALELYRLAIKYHPAFSISKLNKEKVYAKLFPGKEYKDIKMRQLMSYLTGKVQEFLSLQQYQQHKEQQLADFLQTLQERQSGLFELDWAAYERNAGNPTGIGAEGFRYRYDALEIYNAHAEHLAQKEGRRLDVKLHQAAKELDSFFIISKLKLFGDILNYRRILNDEQEVLLIDEILQHVQQTDYSHIPAIGIYLSVILCFTGPDEERHFFDLKNALQLHGAGFAPLEARRLYGMAQNFCIRRINSGKQEYLKELFDIYRSLLDTGLILDNGELSPWDFKNIIAVALRLNETDWTANFMEQFSHYIAPELRDNALSYNRAKYYYQLKEYDKVLDLLQQVSYTDIFYNLDSRVTLLKTYYELDEWDALLGFLDSFKTFLQRQKQISAFHKTAYGLLIRYVRKLVTLPPGDKAKLSAYTKAFEAEAELPDKAWLREKVAELY